VLSEQFFNYITLRTNYIWWDDDYVRSVLEMMIMSALY